MSSPQLKRQATQLIKVYEQIRKDTKQKDSRQHRLFLSVADPALKRFIANVYDDLGIPFPKGKSVQQVVQEFITFHRTKGRKTWRFEEDSKGLIITAGSASSFTSWKTAILPEFFLGKGFDKEKASKAISRELQLSRAKETTVAGTSVKQLESRAKSFSQGVFFSNAIRGIARDVKVNAQSEVKVTTRGKVSKRAVFKLKYQTAKENNAKDDAKITREILKFLRSIAGEQSAPKRFGTRLLDVVEDILRWGKVKRKGLHKSRAGASKTIQEKIKGSGYTSSKISAKEEKEDSPEALKTYLNSRLQQQVASNMVLPALVYRTGRFASSTQIVDVQESQKEGEGYVVSYTYMRYPYEVFEMGSGSSLATPNRDPRTIIGQSIREVAQEIAFTRFGLRRL